MTGSKVPSSPQLPKELLKESPNDLFGLFDFEFFERAFERREKLLDGSEFRKNQAFRAFHGPTEGQSLSKRISVDIYGSGLWVTHWDPLSSTQMQDLAEFLSNRGWIKKMGVIFGVIISREPHCLAPSQMLFGEVPAQPWTVQEWGAIYEIRFRDTRHPGLFLDHSPLRQDLIQQNWCRGKTVLNTFAYTGSLSVACGLGGASEVLTLDISKPTIEWAKANWALNFNGVSNTQGLCKADYIFGDALDWLSRFKKKNRFFDVVILDPPSFSRVSARTFSTSKDLVELHKLAFDVLGPRGILITSINSENVSRKDYWDQIDKAGNASRLQKKRQLKILKEIGLASTFTGVELQKSQSYLKGWVLESD